MTQPDGELVDAYVAGDMRAFSEIVERHRTRLLWVARKYGHNEDDAQDIVQEALLRASRKLHTYRHESSLSTWLHRLVMNTGWDFRNHRRQVETTTLDEEAVPHEINLRLSIDPIRQREVILQLREALDRLRPDQRTALWLIDVVGYSVAHVAEQEGVPPGTIKSRRARARTALREDMWGAAAQAV
ncbi:sigma-70 family RNA polymerase sigma factor [Corynebacterium suedekumii]|uniref:Sigma-70 family RNA polymerase sigma factor n=1 Tax=Corynebacterium suedekumii TaxID=3049801 RepID=A0ABY8VN61_9CORY|nr:sigma-70 family RNA polymerase sigma factor [Corynebacterium suedekumii]WIM70963.1 sigma-70 family RNA polymerase sigma factor [Corynebacterium suedekumii]